MALDLDNSPYAMSLPRPAPPGDAPGYNRHYAQRIREMGQSSKDSWIKRLWHHMFQGNNIATKNENGKVQITNHKDPSVRTTTGSPKMNSSNRGGPNTAKSAPAPTSSATIPAASGALLPPISANQKATNQQNTTIKKEVHFATDSGGGEGGKSGERGEGGVRSAPPRGRTGDSATPTPSSGKVIPAQLADSPYIPVRERTNYKVLASSDKKMSASLSSSSAGDRSARRSKESPFMKKPGAHPYLSQHKDEWRPKLTRGVSMITLEKRAKSTAEKAMKEGKIFTCEGPYPLDTYVRLSLRRRGWVEKFGPKASGCTKSTADKIECEDDEDFEAIMDHYIPAPWEEDHGIYAIMSRIVRHYPAKFIWGGRNVNSMVLRQEVIVNHFPKARYFSSKVGLSNSLRELAWLCSQDAHDFFPRCYTICEDEKEDITEDFRLTTCMCLLRWVVKMYTDKRAADDADGPDKLPRENTKYEEVTFQEDKQTEEKEENEEEINGDKEEEDKEDKEETEEANETRTESQTGGDSEVESVKAEDVTDNSLGEEKADKEEKKEEQNKTNAEVKEKSDDKEEKSDDNDDKTGDQEEKEADEKTKEGDDDDEVKKEGKEGKEKKKEGSKANGWHQKKPNPVRVPVLKAEPPGPRYANKDRQQTNHLAPDLRRSRKKQLEIPVKAVDWSLSQLDKFLQSKNHDDLDSKSPRGISAAQWDQLITWFYQVANENATIPMTERKLRECEEMLRRVRKVWPQYELDGDRNVWIVKPADKSKGIGIEFVNKLEDIIKYSRDTQSGLYVLQKYVERPLLVCKCKFDIRQWFLVTDWNPLTVWFYRESYLRICSQEFSYDTMHEAVHLSNVAVQQNYINDGRRNSKIPDDNFMPCSDFKQLLADVGEYCGWDEITYPGMKDAIVNVMLATQDITETRKSAFELYGADFILTEDYQPWLLEINACPGMAPSSLQKAKLCAAVVDDTIKVVLDRRENKHCDTGNFELAFKDSPLPNTKCVETKFLLEGQRIRRGDLAKYNQIDQKLAKLEKQKEKKRIEKENGVSGSPPSKEEVAVDKDEPTVYLSVDLYSNKEGDNKENEVEEEDEDSENETPEKERKSSRDTDRSQQTSNRVREKTTMSSEKRVTTSAKLDKIDQILKQSPYNNPKPPTTEKQKKAK